MSPAATDSLGFFAAQSEHELALLFPQVIERWEATSLDFTVCWSGEKGRVQGIARGCP